MWGGCEACGVGGACAEEAGGMTRRWEACRGVPSPFARRQSGPIGSGQEDSLLGEKGRAPPIARQTV